MVCAKAALGARDPHMRAALTDLAEFWFELTLHETSEISESTALDVLAIERMQAELLGNSPAVH
jgi:hypothetical protein